jgi:hypothetical protein
MLKENKRIVQVNLNRSGVGKDDREGIKKLLSKRQ